MINNYIIRILTYSSYTVVEQMDPKAPRSQDPSELTM